MAYLALLFCPEEKTARTVTQVLSELEFSVEPCTEPFAAVKKLMSQHFDAVVVDCDNEQNATLLFKSARNSTSNQASLAVAIVEGQAGVAKAFRIGANLVLTKPINVEQSKGTLRVARGLLRKGEPVKPGTAPAAPPPAPKPLAAKPAPPAKSAMPAVPRPAGPPVAKPAAPIPQVPTAVASAKPSPTVQNEIAAPKSAPPAPAASRPAAPPAAPKIPEAVPAPVASKPVPTAAPESPVGMFGGGAASAPAPAREIAAPVETPAAPVSGPLVDSKPHVAEELFEKPAEAVPADQSVAPPSSEPAPTFTFGGANESEEPSGIGQKAMMVGAFLLVIIVGYVAWNHFQGSGSHSNSTVPAATMNAPSSPAPSTVSTPASSSTAAPASAPAEPKPFAGTTQPKGSEDLETESGLPSAPASTKPANSAATTAKSASPANAESEPEPQPLVVKGGSVPVRRPNAPVTDTSAPSVVGIAASAGSNGALSDIAGGSGNAPQPVLQTLNVSQGVSQGLVLKRVQPVYPKSAMTMHIEGAVELTATISKAGSITSVKVLKGDPQLSRAAVDAVKQWKYKPYLLDGEPVEIQTQITVNFKLPH